MQRIVLARVGFGEIGVALPVGFQIAVGQTRPAVAVAHGGTAMGKRVSPGVEDLVVGGLRGAREITLLFGRIAPCAVRVPVPRFDHQFRVLAIGHGPPSRAQKLLEDRAGQQPLGILLVRLPGVPAVYAQPVNGSTECPRGTEGIHRVGRRGVHHNILCARRARQPKAYACAENAPFHAH